MSTDFHFLVGVGKARNLNKCVRVDVFPYFSNLNRSVVVDGFRFSEFKKEPKPRGTSGNPGGRSKGTNCSTEVKTPKASLTVAKCVSVFRKKLICFDRQSIGLIG